MAFGTLLKFYEGFVRALSDTGILTRLAYLSAVKLALKSVSINARRETGEKVWLCFDVQRAKWTVEERKDIGNL